MSNRIIKFGATSMEPVVAAFRQTVGRTPFKLFELETSLEQAMEYREFDGSLASALDSLAKGRLASVQMVARLGTVA